MLTPATGERHLSGSVIHMIMTTRLLRHARHRSLKACLLSGLLAAMCSATLVSTSRAEDIDLAGRTFISDSEAKELAEKSWDGLYAKDVTKISDAAIILLAGHKGTLVLRNLPDVSLPAAKALGQHEGVLNVGGSTLGDEVIEHLARNRGELGLNFLKSLSPRAANSVAKHHEGVLGLTGLDSLSLESARGLAPHVGVINLSGITSLPEATATELARGNSELYFAEHKAFKEETRVALSGHCGRVNLSSVALPQYFPPDVGWKAEAATRNNTRNTTGLIGKVIDESLGTKSEGAGGFSLSGVRLGMHLRDLHGLNTVPNVLENDPTRFLVPAPGDNGNPRPASPVCVRVDSLTGEIVCVEKVFFNTAVDELVEDVVKTYGKTPQEIETLAIRGPKQLRKQTAFRYTFPNEIVRVSQLENIASNGATKQCWIWLCSRKWTERNLRSYANAVLTACDWAKAAMKSCDGGDFDTTTIPPLPGTKRNTAIQNAPAVFADIHRSELLDNKAIVDRSDREGREIVASPIVAAVGQVDGMLVIVICPFNSTVAGFRPLSTLDQLGSQADIRSTHAGDLLKHVGNTLVQGEFPPATEQITVVREVVNEYSFRFREENPSGFVQLKTLFDKTDCCRYEWVAENGWTVRVCFDGLLCFFRKPQKRLD